MRRLGVISLFNTTSASTAKVPTLPASVGVKKPHIRPPTTTTKTLLPRGFLTFGAEFRIDFAPDIQCYDKRHGNHKAGDDAGQKELANRGFGEDAINDEYNARGYDHTQRTYGGHGAAGESLVITIAVHFRHGDGCKRCCRGGGGTAYGLERRGGNHRAHSQPA
jgi:hypothetical protein